MLDNTSNQPPKFRTNNWVEINDDVRGIYSPNKQIRFKRSKLRSSLCDYSDAYIPVKGNITVNNTVAAGADVNNTNKKVMPMYNLIEYSDNYSKTSGSLWQYCKDIPHVNNNGAIVKFNGDNDTDLFNFKAKITGQTNDDGE